MLNAIYEADFLGFSYGFRPGRSQHDALDALSFGIIRTPVNWILDADIRSFFDTVSHAWLVRFLEHRVGDERILRLVRKWLKAGVLEDGEWSASEAGTPQGAVISPLLANVYLHYVFDLWAERWRRREARGRVILVRYADDIVAGFQYEADARRFWEAMRARMEQLRRRMHAPIPAQGAWLRRVVTGFFAYHAVPTNFRALGAFRYHVMDLWRRTLRRRSQKDGMTWERMARIADTWLPKPRILHPWPEQRFAVTHRGGSPVRESRPPGSVRGVPGNGHPYRDHTGTPMCRHLYPLEIQKSRIATGEAFRGQAAIPVGLSRTHAGRTPGRAGR